MRCDSLCIDGGIYSCCAFGKHEKCVFIYIVVYQDKGILGGFDKVCGESVCVENLSVKENSFDRRKRGADKKIDVHWAAMDLQFDAIYSGFLGSADQVDTVARFFDTFKKSDTAVIVDPVMGDHGTAYRTCTPELCRGMRALAENADVITPNLTEAALLLDRPYEEIRQSDAYEVVRRLSLGGRRSVVLTGSSSEPGKKGAL